MRHLVITLATVVLAACNGGETPQPGDSPTEASPTAAALVTGDGSEFCLATEDLPQGYLPLAGQDNTSNAEQFALTGEDVPPVAQEKFTASWMALPQGGAGSEDRTASCVIYIFSDAEIDEIWTWYADGYTERQDPSPEEVPLPPGAPGEDARLFDSSNEFSGRAGSDYIFRYANVIVNIDVSAGPSEDTVDDTIALATIVQGRLQAGGS